MRNEANNHPNTLYERISKSIYPENGAEIQNEQYGSKILLSVLSMFSYLAGNTAQGSQCRCLISVLGATIIDMKTGHNLVIDILKGYGSLSFSASLVNNVAEAANIANRPRENNPEINHIVTTHSLIQSLIFCASVASIFKRNLDNNDTEEEREKEQNYTLSFLIISSLACFLTAKHLVSKYRQETLNRSGAEEITTDIQEQQNTLEQSSDGDEFSDPENIQSEIDINDDSELSIYDDSDLDEYFDAESETEEDLTTQIFSNNLSHHERIIQQNSPNTISLDI